MWLSNHARTAGAWLFALLLSGELHAVPSDPPGLTLEQAVANAIAKNPELQSTQYSLRVADARITQADLSPSPELSLELEDFGGTGVARGGHGAQATLSLSQVIEMGGKRDRRRESAQFERRLLSVDSQARQLDVLAEVTRRFLVVAADQEQLQLAHRSTALAEKTRDQVSRRVAAAKSPAVEMNRARIALVRAQVNEEHAEHELLTSRRKLAAMWGSDNPQFSSVAADLYRLPALGDFDALMERLKTNPDFTRFASEARLRDAELRLAETRRVPNVHVGAGIRRLQETQDQAFVFNVSMPLFAGRHSSGAVAEATARQSKVAVDEQAAYVRAQAQLFELYQEMRHSLTEADILRKEVLPQMESALEQTEYAYQRGRYSYVEWIDAQRELIDVRRSLIEACANAHRYHTEIERLTGEPLSTENPVDAAP